MPKQQKVAKHPSVMMVSRRLENSLASVGRSFQKFSNDNMERQEMKKKNKRLTPAGTVLGD